ncbi:hypothetical protein VB005_09689 [Metarhizium brunneum]
MFSTISQTSAQMQMTTVDAASMAVPSIVPGFVSIYTSNGKVYAVLQLGSSQSATPASSPSTMTTLPAEGKSFSSPPLPTVTPSTETSMLDMEPFSTSRSNTSARPTTLATSTSLPPIVPENMTETGIVSAMERGGLSSPPRNVKASSPRFLLARTASTWFPGEQTFCANFNRTAAMCQDQGLQPASIERLSVELLQMVLLELPDVSSLRAAALSCPLLYEVFLDAETTITTQVLLKQIDDSVLPEAELAFLSSSLHHGPEPEYQHGLVDFITQNLRQRPTPPRSWSLQKALQLERLHLCVSELTQKFVHTTLTTYPMTQGECTATRLERCRIERAFYRFEIYCNLFRMLPEIDVELPTHIEKKRLFIACFAPWENEQLGCIHDFLVRAASPAFNDIAEHDIAWGAFRAEYDDKIDSPFIQHVLSRGLKKLLSIILAETYLERHRLLYSRGFPPATDNFLYEGLESANGHNDNVFLESLSPTEEALLFQHSFFRDPDSGPRDAWKWAHLEESRAHWVYVEDRDNLRRWG